MTVFEMAAELKEANKIKQELLRTQERLNENSRHREKSEALIDEMRRQIEGKEANAEARDVVLKKAMIQSSTLASNDVKVLTDLLRRGALQSGACSEPRHAMDLDDGLIDQTEWSIDAVRAMEGMQQAFEQSDYALHKRPVEDQHNLLQCIGVFAVVIDRLKEASGKGKQ